MLDKMKQLLEILIKLKFMVTSYVELFNGSMVNYGKSCAEFLVFSKKVIGSNFPAYVYAVLCGNTFFHFITIST